MLPGPPPRWRLAHLLLRDAARLELRVLEQERVELRDEDLPRHGLRGLVPEPEG